MLNEHPDPFDSYRLDRAEEKAVLTILPPMNLGTGPSSAAMSKNNSAAEALVVKDARQRDDGHAATSSATPRQLANAPVSVSDVLGLNQPDGDNDDEPPSRRSPHAQAAPTQDDAGSRSSPSSIRHSRRASHDRAQAAEPATSSASSSPALDAADSSALPTSSSMATVNPFDAPSLLTERQGRQAAADVAAQGRSTPALARERGQRRAGGPDGGRLGRARVRPVLVAGHERRERVRQWRGASPFYSCLSRRSR